MRKIRIGNDIGIKWEIFTYSGNVEVPYILEGKDLNIYLCGPLKKLRVLDFSIKENVISFIFRGKDQQHVGKYSLILIENEEKNNMHTLDECCAFRLVSRSCEEDDGGNGDDGNIEITNVDLSSRISSGASNVDVDEELSIESENPVQNKVITEKFSHIEENIEILSLRHTADVESLSQEISQLSESVENKVDKVSGKQLSTEDFTTRLKQKLEQLEGYDDTYLMGQLDTKQDIIEDLETIRSGAELGATALQSHQDISHLATKDEVAEVESQLDNKQDTIDDLASIRTGAALGHTAIQSHQDISHLATKEEVESANAKQDEEITALDEARTGLASQIAENKSRIDSTATNVLNLTEQMDTLTGNGEGSIDDIVSNKIAEVIASAPEDLDTLKEIADFIESDAAQAAEIVTKLDDHEERITAIESQNLDFVVTTESVYDMLPEKEEKLYFLYEDE